MLARCPRLVAPAGTAAVLAVFALFALATPASAAWVNFIDESGDRMVSDAALGLGDTEEKDYAWGDVDQDGDVDLVVVRKEPFTSAGKRTNVLFLNQNGVLVDRTQTFATDSLTPGDQGFLTPTNDRDVILVDVNNDGWLDIVTAVTLSDGDPKHIGHPRIYMNKGLNTQGSWAGFRHENSRIPAMLSYSGVFGFNPRFCSVSAGDVTGDGFVDLFFGDYDSSGSTGLNQPPGADFNDRLLINDGTGYFRDVTFERFQGVVPGVNQRFEVSAFGAANGFADFNDDGFTDIVKQTSLNSPLYVGIAYNKPTDEGFFDTYEIVNQQSPYFVSVGDLNQDHLPDLVITDDFADRFMLHQGVDVNQTASFASFTFQFDGSPGDDMFGSQSLIVDLDDDGWNDVLISDVDVDIAGCNRRLHIYHNQGGIPGGNVALREEREGSSCSGNPASCLVASIPANKLKGTFHTAVFDIDQDGALDLILGQCTGTRIFMGEPPPLPSGLSFAYPNGHPDLVPPDQPFTFEVEITGFGGATPVPGSESMFVSVDGGPFQEIPLMHAGGSLYEATLPAAACSHSFDFFLQAQASTTGEIFTDPAQAPFFYSAVSGAGIQVIAQNGFEADVSGWSVLNDGSLTGGGWEAADPVGTIDGLGNAAAPEDDAENPGTRAFVTQNGAPGGLAGASDVDGGPTDLISPPFDLDGTDGTVRFSRWFYSANDSLVVSVSGDGVLWVDALTISGTTQNSWNESAFRVGDFITPTSTVQVRFRVSDNPNDTTTEAAIDAFRVDRYACTSCSSPMDCDDAVHCNGAEDCIGNVCVAGSDPCPGELCDEANDVCVECFVDEDCADGDFCNGTETCSGGTCLAGSDPCPGELCDESNDVCVECFVNGDCDDGLFCNGLEACAGGACVSVPESCPGQLCDEQTDTCIGSVSLQPRMGQPLLGLTAEELDRFLAGRAEFDHTFSIPEGLGPIFNQDSCGSCHSSPLGGSGSIVVTRFGHNDDKGGGFDDLDHLGGSLLQAEAISAECAEEIPPESNVMAHRLTNSTLGFGLVEAIPDADIEALATNPPPLVSGRVHTVEAFEDPGVPRVGRFGWKCQVATVLTFSADAALNEIGITNRFVGAENDPNGVNPPSLGPPENCDTIPDPEDGPDGEGLHFIDRVTDFQRFLAPPPQTPRNGMTGEAVFNNIGCANCHVQAFTTPNDPELSEALRAKTLKPYSDFLLHDAGLNADFIEQGQATGRELRTTPLWGLRIRDPLWHDGRFAAGTFPERVTDAIMAHGVLNSEAQFAASNFGSLSVSDKNALIAFLDSLGRAEFDMDGDGDLDSFDLDAFEACFTGPAPGTYGPDDACAVGDPDQDGDVDDDDRQLFLEAVSGGAAGEIIDLRLGLEPGGDVTLSWDGSCLFTDNDFGVYEGILDGVFQNHASRLCTTGGATSATLTPVPGDAIYYLVVPTNGFREGGYGSASDGTPRPQGAGACMIQQAQSCF